MGSGFAEIDVRLYLKQIPNLDKAKSVGEVFGLPIPRILNDLKRHCVNAAFSHDFVKQQDAFFAFVPFEIRLEANHLQSSKLFPLSLEANQVSQSKNKHYLKCVFF